MWRKLALGISYGITAFALLRVYRLAWYNRYRSVSNDAFVIIVPVESKFEFSRFYFSSFMSLTLYRRKENTLTSN